MCRIHRALLILIAICFNSYLVFGGFALKEVEFDWNSPAIIWQGQTGKIPCLEPFYIKVKNLPAGIEEIQINVYKSTGKGSHENPIAKGDLMSSYTAVAKSDKEYSALVSNQLLFKRFYYIEVVVKTTTISLNKETKVYGLPMNNEISYIEFYGGIGMAGFGQKSFKGFEPNVGFATGLKVKLFPISTNKNIGRFGLYPKASRFSFVVATAINDLTYKSTDLKAILFGLKPIMGFDFEFSRNIGISGGVVLANQDTKSKLTNQNNPVAGLWLSLTFSSAVFQSFRNTVPASSNLPSVPNSQTPNPYN